MRETIAFARLASTLSAWVGESGTLQISVPTSRKVKRARSPVATSIQSLPATYEAPFPFGVTVTLRMVTRCPALAITTESPAA